MENEEDIEEIMAKRDLLNQKLASYYSILVQQWHENKMVSTKTIVNLSAGAIGLLVTLTSVVKFDRVMFGCFFWAMLFFGITILIAFWTWRLNAQYLDLLIAKNIQGEEEDDDESNYFIERKERFLKKIDFSIIVVFMIAVMFGSLVPTFISIKNLQGVTEEMSNESKPQGQRITDRSLAGAGAHNPAPSSKPVTSTNTSNPKK